MSEMTETTTDARVAAIMARAFPGASENVDAYLKAHGCYKRDGGWGHFTNDPRDEPEPTDKALPGMQEFDAVVCRQSIDGKFCITNPLQRIANAYHWRLAHPDAELGEDDDIEAWAAANVPNVFEATQ